jgi:hypothetical protein
MSDGVNPNQGAESTLSFLLSLLAIIARQGEAPCRSPESIAGPSARLGEARRSRVKTKSEKSTVEKPA